MIPASPFLLCETEYMAIIDKTDETGRQKINEIRNSVTFSGTDITVVAYRNNFATTSTEDATFNFIQLGSLHTFSYSSFREKFAVRSLGRSHAQAYTRSARTIAGTMVFNVLQSHELMKLASEEYRIDDKSSVHPRAVMLDQLEPFDLLLLFVNEYGGYSMMHLFNVEVSSEGQQMSVDDIITHNTLNYYATDLVPMTSLGNSFESYQDMVLKVNPKYSGVNDDSSSQSGISSNKEAQRPNAIFSNVFAQSSLEVQDMLASSRGLF